MPYTLWSRGELLGQSELSYVRVLPTLRMGDLELTPRGLTIFERLCQYRADAYYTVRRMNRAATIDVADRKSLEADLAAQHDQYEALALELRAPNGTVIPTDDIYVTDTEYLLSIADDASEEDTDGALEDVLSPEDLQGFEEQLREFEQRESWSDEPERPPARFQISVQLQNEWSVP